MKFWSWRFHICIHWVSLTSLVTMNSRLQRTDFSTTNPLTAMLNTSVAMNTFCIFILVANGTQCLMKSCWLMAYSHCQIWTQTQIRIPNPMATEYYSELFTLVQIQIQIPTQMVSQMWHFRDRSLSLLHTFQSQDQSLNLNQCEISA